MLLYLIRNKTTGMEYVGTTTRSLSLRWNDHRYRAKGGERISPLYDAIREIGIENFEMLPLGVAVSYEQLLEMERDAIKARNTLHPNGYNLVAGGRGNFGWRMKPETRQKIAASHKGRVGWSRGIKRSPEFCEAVRQAQLKAAAQRKADGVTKPAWNRGVPFTAEHKAKVSAGLRGRKLSVSHLEKISARVRTDAERAKVAAAKKQWWASRTTEERQAHVEKMRSGRQRQQVSVQ